MRPLINTFWLTGKELKSVLGDPVMVILIAWSFVVAVMLEAQGAGDTVRNAPSPSWMRIARPCRARSPTR